MLIKPKSIIIPRTKEKSRFAATTLTALNFASHAFQDTVKAMIADKLAFLSSGILVNEPMLSSQTGHFADVPHYNKLAGSAEQLVADTDLAVNAITQYNDIGVWLERGKAWGSEDWTKWVAGENPMDEIASQVANFYSREIHAAFISVLTGIFTTELLATHSTGNTYNAGTIDVDPIIGAKKLLGDSANVLTRAVMNSKIWHDALKKEIASYALASQGGTFNTGQLGTLFGMTASMEDLLTAVANVYSTYFSAPGAGIYSIREQNTEAERQALKAGGTDILVTRISFMVHVPGVKWNVATTNPTNAQLATDTNWSKVETENRNIQIVELKTM